MLWYRIYKGLTWIPVKPTPCACFALCFNLQMQMCIVDSGNSIKICKKVDYFKASKMTIYCPTPYSCHPICCLHHGHLNHKR